MGQARAEGQSYDRLWAYRTFLEGLSPFIRAP